jgi:hypothetical protein
MKPNKPAFPGAASGSSEDSSPAGGRASRQAHRALRQHAVLFEALGMRTTRELENAFLLEDDDLTFSLEYGLRWKLLSRIYNLRASMEVASPGEHAGAPYRLTLKTRGLVGASRDLATAAGPADKEGQRVADRVTASGLVDELAGKVDLESLSIAWVPEAGAWRVALEPYPGSYIHVLLPPIRYTVRLKEPEVVAIRTFLVDLSGVLRRSTS